MTPRKTAPFDIDKCQAMQNNFGFYIRGNFDLSDEQLVKLLNAVANSPSEDTAKLVDRLYKKFYQEIQDERG